MKNQKLLEKVLPSNGQLIQFQILVLFPVKTGVPLKMLKTFIRSRQTKKPHARFNVKIILFHRHLLELLDFSFRWGYVEAVCCL